MVLEEALAEVLGEVPAAVLVEASAVEAPVAVALAEAYP